MFSYDELSNDELDETRFRLFKSRDTSVIDRHLNRFSYVLSRLSLVAWTCRMSSVFMRSSADLKRLSSSELGGLSFDSSRFSADLKRSSFDFTMIWTIEDGWDEDVDSAEVDELVDEIDCCRETLEI